LFENLVDAEEAYSVLQLVAYLSKALVILTVQVEKCLLVSIQRVSLLVFYLKEIVRKCVGNISCLDVSEEEATAEVGSNVWSYSIKSVPLNISIKLIQLIDIIWSLTIPVNCSGKVDLTLIQRIELCAIRIILIRHHLNEWTISLKRECQNKL